MTRGWGLFWGAILVLVGALALLFNVGLIRPEQIDRVVVLWPLLLILVGAEIVLSRLATRTVATVTMSVIVLLVLVGTIGYVASAPPVGRQHRTFAALDGGSGPATLRIELGASTVQLDAAALSGQAGRAALDYSGPGGDPVMTWDRGARVLEISRSQPGLLPLGPGSPDRLAVTLNSALPWKIELDTGASSVTAHLEQVALQGLTVNGGAVTLTFGLGPPSGAVALTVNGGASHVQVSRPAGSAIHVELQGGANSLNADGREVGNSLGGISWSSPGYPAADEYQLTIEGGANQVTVSEAA